MYMAKSLCHPHRLFERVKVLTRSQTENASLVFRLNMLRPAARRLFVLAVQKAHTCSA